MHEQMTVAVRAIKNARELFAFREMPTLAVLLMVAAKREWKLPEVDEAIDYLIPQSINAKPEDTRKAAKEIARMVLGE